MQDKEKEKKVFSQELNRDDLKAAAGGSGIDYQACKREYFRSIYNGGFPNCANTVEDGSVCDEADACFGASIQYKDMEGCVFADCHRSWR